MYLFRSLFKKSTDEDKDLIYRFHNESEYMKGILIERKESLE